MRKRKKRSIRRRRIVVNLKLWKVGEAKKMIHFCKRSPNVSVSKRTWLSKFTAD